RTVDCWHYLLDWRSTQRDSGRESTSIVDASVGRSLFLLPWVCLPSYAIRGTGLVSVVDGFERNREVMVWPICRKVKRFSRASHTGDGTDGYAWDARFPAQTEWIPCRLSTRIHI
ncbi:unnamed protein product, partial [Ectocarpus sp. 12 AP-2014]